MADTLDFLLEIGVEEMPSAPLINASKQLPKLVESRLDAAGLSHGAVRVVSSPRRLAAIVESVACETEAIHESLRGPKAQIAFDADGNPTKAAQGFARKCGIDASELSRAVADDGNEYVFAEKNVPSAPAMPILSTLGHDVIAAIEWPNYRSQRWGSEHETFVRPIRWICALLGSEVVPMSYADVISANVTFGHRVLAPGARVVADPAAYEGVLEAAYVLSAERREAVIRESISKIESERPGSSVDTPKRIFDEVVNLCEWPTVLVGKFDEEYLKVPQEIICESMLSNQRYFPIFDAEGKLTREFVIVSNADPKVSATVVSGNERVVRPRLDDAKFFFEEDLKHPMEDFVQRLGIVTFQEKLGTTLQKVERMEKIAGAVAQAAGQDETGVANAVRAAHLAKADLVSQAVVEFTNQQGVMGGYYAEAAGEPAEVACAIREHYRPRFAGDELPSNTCGKCVAIADKLDTACGIFAIDEPPTGSSDPFAIRRSAIGIIQMLRTMPSVHLAELVDLALAFYKEQGLEFDAEAVSRKVCQFFAGRLKSIAKDEGIHLDSIEAVSAVGVIDPAEFIARARALDTARAEQPEVFDDLAAAFTRAHNLADASLGTEVDESKLGNAERALLSACVEGEEKVSSALADSDFEAACGALAALKEPIDRFFDDVLVMDEHIDVRENRLRLLNRFAGVFAGVADISALSRKK
ncbi:glycine--tRNA ligase subunit beta [Paratractidigestivibacter sp.]|uniref:glycine--tRNA ligase subunit beta n=1 Tax=Paratractidigestivibacter sp. TaxID=2847316 RepID=UPI002AC8A26D|nr:glycine--tRNA ligase subunit beta [Paratractidigestivibacter sp.]